MRVKILQHPLFLSSALTALLGPCTSRAQFVGPLTFETGTASSNDFTDNFRITTGQGIYGQTDPADVGEPNNDYVFQEKSVAGNAVIGIYDTTPSNGTDATQAFSTPIVVSLDVSAVGATSSFGIFFFNATNSSDNLLALLNLDASGSNETFRLFRDNALSGTGSANQLGTTITGNGGLNVSPEASPTFGTLTVTYTPGTTSDQITLSLGSLTNTFTVTGTDRLSSTNFGVAFRLNDDSPTAGSAKFDNFSISAVPEPTAGLAFLAGGMLLASRRRRSPAIG